MKKTAIFFSATLGLSLSSCTIRTDQSENLEQSTQGKIYGAMDVNVNKYATNKIVCDPFDDSNVGIDNQTITYENGIKASLHYLTDVMPRMYKSQDYVSFGYKSSQDLFMRDINVPTRLFDQGFKTSEGKILANDNGQRLIEYFGLKMTTNIMLVPQDEPGDYELALLSDDGTTLSIVNTDSREVLIDNDGDHPTRLGCAKRVVNFKRDTMLPIELTYYQGPRYHISNVMLYRKSSTAGKDSACGLTGNETFFNPDQDSAPQTAYQNLLNRGWKVLTPQHFVLSKTVTGGNGGGEEYNPCVQGEAPVISNFAINDIASDTAYFTWNTDIPATAQVQLTNTTTGEVTTPVSDNLLRTDHFVTVSGLKKNTIYKVKAVSVSKDLGRAISTEELILEIGDF